MQAIPGQAGQIFLAGSGFHARPRINFVETTGPENIMSGDFDKFHWQAREPVRVASGRGYFGESHCLVNGS